MREFFFDEGPLFFLMMLAEYVPSNVRYNVPANYPSAKPKALQVAVRQLTHNSSADFCMEAG